MIPGGATPDDVPLRRFAALDRAVFAAYGRPEGIGDEEEILKNLLALDLQRGECAGKVEAK